MATNIGRMFEATKDGMQVMSGEDPEVEVNNLAWKNSSSKKNGSSKKKHDPVQKLDILPKCAQARKAMST